MLVHRAEAAVCAPSSHLSMATISGCGRWSTLDWRRRFPLCQTRPMCRLPVKSSGPTTAARSDFGGTPASTPVAGLAVIYIHGGSLISGTLHTHGRLAGHSVQLTGVPARDPAAGPPQSEAALVFVMNS